MKTIRLGLLFLGLLLLSLSLSAQKNKIKFGKVAIADLEQNTYEPDPKANAVVLYDRGHSSFDYDTNGDRGFVIKFKRHQRIKILKEAGKDWADFEVPLYRNTRRREKIRSFKAITHCLENGIYKDYTITKNDIFEEVINENWINAKFAMPNVQVGSILEIQYEVESDFAHNLPSWDFQYTIPSVWSEYVVEIPEFYFYNRTMRGYNTDRMTVNENSSQVDHIVFHGTQRSDGLVVTSRSYSESVDYKVNTDRIVMENMPAFKEEVYMLNAVDFLTGIDIELAATDFPGSSYQAYTTNWNELRDELYDFESVGGQLRKSGWVKDYVNPLVKDLKSPEDKMAAIYEFVRRSMAWNGKYRIAATNSLKKSFEEGQGSSGDINLILHLMLEKAGLDCAPVFLSTRSHGRINPIHPSFDDFNYVIAGVQLGEEYVLLDATDKMIAPGLIPMRCLNGQGRWMSLSANKWVDLYPGKGYATTIQLDLSFNEEMELEGNYQSMHKGHAALSRRWDIQNAESEEEYYEEWASEIEGIELTSFETQDFRKTSKPLREKLEFIMEEGVEEAADLIYFNPLLFLQMEENPFKASERVYPVSFACPVNYRYIVKIELPEGYGLDEIPEPMMIAMPNKGGKFTYDVKAINASTLLVSCNFKIKQLQFLSEEYPILKEFYDQALQKQGTQLVLKRSQP